MRISVFSAFYPFRGGIAQFNSRLYRVLESKNEVSAFTFTKQYPSLLFPGKTQFVDAKDSADKIPAIRIVNPFNPFTFFKAIKELRKSNPEVFIMNYWMSFFGLCFGILGKYQNKGTKRIALIHNLIPHEQKFYDRFLNRYFLKQYDGFVVMSDVVEKDLISLKPDARYIKIAHPWYDHFGTKIEKTEALQKLNIPQGKNVLLFFGLIRDYKGLDLLLDSFEHLSNEYILLIAGEIYGNEAFYNDKIKNSAASERIYFHNRYILDEEVKYYFSAADCCVLPYKSATQSGITAVAFHFELPVIVTDVGGLRETVESTQGGIVIDKPEVKPLLKGIEELFENNKMEFYRENIKTAKKENSWDHFAAKLTEFAEHL